MPAIGFDRFLPMDGAFYLYADVARLTNDSVDFARRMLLEAGVAATPGPDFDTARGSAFVRFSFAGTNEDVAEAATAGCMAAIGAEPGCLRQRPPARSLIAATTRRAASRRGRDRCRDRRRP